MIGLERIKKMSEQIQDASVLKIVEYLLSRKDMNEKYLNEDKSLKQMIDFIKDKAEKVSKDGVAMVEDDVVYGWAIHYWDEPNEKLEFYKNSSNNKEIKKAKVNSSKKESKQKNWVPDGQLTLF